ISSGLYFLSFWFYLGTLTRCLEAPRAGLIVGLFALILGPAVAGTVYLAIGRLDARHLEMYAPWVACFWLAVPLYWIMMVVVVKRTIDQTLPMVKDPLRYYSAPRRLPEL